MTPLLLLVLLLPPAAPQRAPRCRLTPLASQAPGPTRGEVRCLCRPYHRQYTGNLNFLKAALVGAEEGRLEVVIANCSTLQLELNFHTIGRQNILLRVEDTEVLRVGQVELAPWGEEVQGLEVRRVGEVVMHGAVSCARCHQGLLNIQVQCSVHNT